MQRAIWSGNLQAASLPVIDNHARRQGEEGNAPSDGLFSALRAGAAALAALALLVGLPGEARAQDDEARNFPLERFRLSYDRNGVIGTEWGAVPGHNSWDLGIWFSAADDPLVVSRADDGERLGSLVSRRISGNLVASYSFWNRFQIGLDVPLILSQGGDDAIMGIDPGLDSVSSFGLGDLRVAPKIQLLTADKHFVNMAVVPAFSVPTGAASDYRGDPSLTFQPELAVARAWGALRTSVNLGYYLRSQAQVVDLTIDDELYTRVGVGYRFADRGGPPLEIDGVVTAATAARNPFANSNQDHVELLAGASYAIDRFLPFVVGGVGVRPGFGTPDWRVVIGTRFGRANPRIRDRDGDGLLGDDDQCPDNAEDRDSFEDTDGCPDPDNDGDKIADVDDRCPLKPETVNTFEDDDGCPDVVPDTDGDGLADNVDKCPDKAETVNTFEDDDGCPDKVPDSDGDGLDDNADQCPLKAEDIDSFEDDNGCPDPDNDGDGVLDTSDRCISEPGVVENGGCPDTDRDGDTIVDRLDNCPDEPGVAERQGCKRKQMVKITGKKLEILDVVYFKTNRARIRSRSYKLLKQVAKVIKSHPELAKIRVEGHTDDRGDDNYNKELSQKRAESVVGFLVKQGVAAERLEAVGYGEERPITKNVDRASRATNRRVEFKLIGASGNPIENQRTGPTGDTIDR